MTGNTQQKQDEPSSIPEGGAISSPLIASVAQKDEAGAAGIKNIGRDPVSSRDGLDQKWKFAEETHQYVRDQIKHADQKAAFFFASATALMAFLYKAHLLQLWIINPLLWQPINMLSFFAAIGLAFCVLGCVTTITPRLHGSRRGFIFFAAIAEFAQPQEYVSEILATDIRTLVESELSHVHSLAMICRSKYAALRVGQWAGAVGVVATLLLLFVAP